MGSLLKKSICIDDYRVDVDEPLTEDELVALYQLLTKFSRTCASPMDLVQIIRVREWVEQATMEEVKNNV
jgi:hypothetical protein